MSRSAWSVLLVFAMAAWGSFYLFADLIIGSIDPALLAFFRFFFAALVLTPFVLMWHELKVPPFSEWPMWFILSLLVVSPTALIVIGITHSNSIVSAILMNTNPLIAAALAPLLISERMNLKKASGLVVGFVGVVFVVSNGQTLRDLLSSDYLLGVGLLLFASCLSALFAIYAKRFVREYDGLYTTFITATVGSIVIAVFLGVRGGLEDIVSLDARTFAFAVLIGVVSTATPFVLWSSSLKRLDVSTATSFKLLIPVFATFYALLFLGGSLTVWILAGFVLTSIGVYIVQTE